MARLSKFQIRKINQKRKAIRLKRAKPSKLKREPFNLGFRIRDLISNVSSQQEKLALAKRNGNVLEMEKIIFDILNSVDAKVLAVHRVVVNTGYRSPGLSEGSFRTNADYQAMVDKLAQIIAEPQTYKATPLDRIYLPKPNGGLRPISIPSYLDRCLQSLYKLVLEPITEETSDPSSYGFRPLRSIHWAAGRVLNCLNNPLTKYSYGVSLDIAKYFDKIAHNSIIEKSKGIIPDTIMTEWLSCGYVERESKELFPTTEGVPQGGILSPTLSNTVLDGLEPHIKEFCSTPSSLQAKDNGSAMARYADDIMIFVRSLEMAKLVIQEVNKYLSPRGLSLNLEKTKIIDLNLESFVFVGFEFKRVFRRNNKRLSSYIGVPKSAIDSLRKKIDAKKKSTKSLTDFISEINPIIRGWAYNYRFAHDFRYISRSLRYWLWKKVYAKAYAILKNSKSKAKHEEIHDSIMSRYFSAYKEYSTWPIVHNTKGKPLILADISSVDSANPTFTNSARNAYISTDRIKLETVAIRLTHGVRAKILKSWGFSCASCGNKIGLSGVPYEIHHKRPRQFGGSNKPSNLIPLCKEPCHLDISKAVASKNTELIFDFTEKGLIDLPVEVLSEWTKP